MDILHLANVEAQIVFSKMFSYGYIYLNIRSFPNPTHFPQTNSRNQLMQLYTARTAWSDPD